MEDNLIKMMANEHILISDKMLKLQVENKELFFKFASVKKTFYELLDAHEKIRVLSGFDFDHFNKYYWIEKSGLLDDAE